MVDVNTTFFTFLIIICIGFLLKKFDIVSEENGKFIAKLVINLTLPAVILKAVINIDLEVSLFLLTLIIMLFSIGVSALSLILFKNHPTQSKGIMLMCVIGFNMGNFAYPIIEGIWGQAGLKYIAMLDLGNAFIIFILIYMYSAIFSSKNVNKEKKVEIKYIGMQLFKSVPLICYFIAIILNLSGLTFPLLIFNVLDVLTSANAALNFLLLGIFLNFKFDKSQWKNVIKVLLIRYSIGISIGLLLFFFLPLERLYREILLIGLILPIGMATIAFGVEYEHDQKLIGIMINLTIIISFILMWIIVLIIGG